MKTYTEEYCAAQTSMDLRTMPGMLVIFARFNAGYPPERKRVEELGFEVGRTYEVAAMKVGRSNSDVTLVEFPGLRFNTVFFSNVPGQELPEQVPSEHLDYVMPARK